MNETPEGLSALEAVRLAKFVPKDAKALDAASTAYAPSTKTTAR
jgi:hypothetical protein